MRLSQHALPQVKCKMHVKCILIECFKHWSDVLSVQNQTLQTLTKKVLGFPSSTEIFTNVKKWNQHTRRMWKQSKAFWPCLYGCKTFLMRKSPAEKTICTAEDLLRFWRKSDVCFSLGAYTAFPHRLLVTDLPVRMSVCSPDPLWSSHWLWLSVNLPAFLSSDGFKVCEESRPCPGGCVWSVRTSFSILGSISSSLFA